MQKYEKSCGAFISERIGVIFGMPVGDDNARNLSSIFFQNDPLTNFMHIFREILRNFQEKLQKLFSFLRFSSPSRILRGMSFDVDYRNLG